MRRELIDKGMDQKLLRIRKFSIENLVDKQWIPIEEKECVNMKPQAEQVRWVSVQSGCPNKQHQKFTWRNHTNSLCKRNWATK